jgi:hypothetical protein
MVEGIAPVLYPGKDEDAEDHEPAPEAALWEARSEIMLADAGFVTEAIGVFVGMPGEDPTPAFNSSPLLYPCGVGVMYSRSFLDTALRLGSESQKGKRASGAKIKDLDMSMLDTAIQLKAELHKSGAVIKLDGPVRPRLIRGRYAIGVDTRDVDVTVDEPWTMDLLRALTILGFFLPGGLLALDAMLDALDKPNLWEAEADIASAPGRARSGLASVLGGSLSALAQALDAVGADFGGVTLAGSPDHSIIDSGHMLLLSQAIVRPLELGIESAVYNRRIGRFVSFTLDDGRILTTGELVRLIDADKIVVPGVHTVDGRYLRSNPDNDPGNNINAMFGRSP